jgi:hypothetical protein
VVLQRWQPFLTSWRALFFYRSTALASGVSLFVPLFFLVMVAFWWAFFQLKRSYLSSNFAVESPFPPKQDAEDASFQAVRMRVEEVSSAGLGLLEIVWRSRLPFALLGGAVVGLGLWARTYCLPTVEGPWWDLLFFLGFLLGFLLAGVAVLHFLIFWKKLDNLLSVIALLPMARAFATLPAKVVSNFRSYLRTRRPRFSHILLPRHQLELLEQASAEYAETLAAGPAEDVRETAKRAHTLRTDLDTALGAPQCQEKPWKDVREFSQWLIELLPRVWSRRPLADAYGTELSAAKGPPEAPRTSEPATHTARVPEDRWVELAEGFVATQILIYLSQFFAQLRSLAWAVIISASALLLAGASYPFFPERLLLLLLLGVVAVAVGAVVYVLVQINRNELVSRVLRTTPNRFTPDMGFVQSLLGFAGPVVAVLIGIFGAFRFVLEPILRALR